MQVSDCEQLMRATLRAAHILCHLRGMRPIGIDGVDIDLAAWLARAESIELLDENAHRDVARAFFIEMLSHATKAALFGGRDGAAAAGPSAAAVARARAGANSHAPHRQAIVLDDDQVCLPDRLMEQYGRFITRMQPLVFVAQPGGVRPHTKLDYRLVMVLHCGQRLISVKQSVTQALERLRQLRIAHASSLGGADCPARLFLIVWRDEFRLHHGKQTTALHTAVQAIAATVAAEHITLEMHNVVELQYDATRNERVPRHTAIERATEPGIATIADAEFPTILLTDPQVKLHDFRLGQIIRIERRDIELGYDEIAYRIVRAGAR
jgi:DNA-directed RNA polymerase subunit H (RpoH/RPB5)